jgi:hypothetical protein
MERNTLLVGLLIILFGLIGVIIYFIPTYIASKRSCRRFYGIVILNIFLGWTFLGWVGSLIWAFTDNKDESSKKLINNWIKSAIGFLALGVFVFSFIYMFVYDKPHSDYEKMTPDFTVSASELYNSFKDNTTGSEKRYNGKILAISGTLTKVESNDTMVTAVFVFNQGMFGEDGIRCVMLPSYFEEVKKMQPAGNCRIKGYCTGFNDPDVILEQCSVLK